MQLLARTLVFVSLSAFAASSHGQSTILVPGDQATIQDGIDAALDGDTVLVAPGTYLEHDLDFQGKGITVVSSGGADVTIVDAQQLGRGVQFTTGEGPDAVLDGFTITNGRAGGGAVPGYGGGIVISESSPTVIRCAIVGNEALYGGGIYAKGLFDAPTIVDCLISDNRAWPGQPGLPGFGGRGGGIYMETVFGGLVSGCTLIGNEAGDGGPPGSAGHGGPGGSGGGIYIAATGEITDCVLLDNRAGDGGSGGDAGLLAPGGKGGGVYGGVVTRCVLIGNQAGNGGDTTTGVGGAGGSGGGVAAALEIKSSILAENRAGLGGVGLPSGADGTGGGVSGNPRITGCTIVFNTAGVGGGLDGTGNVRSSILYGNVPDQIGASPSVSYSDVEGGYPGVGNMDLDPLFVDAAGGDYHLGALSPCADAGDPSTAGISTRDFEGEPRFQGAGVDMGADETPAVAVVLPYGCGINPVDSLHVLSGAPLTGTTFELGVDNPLGTQAPGSLPYVALALFPDPAFPCGTPIAGLGMEGPGAPGELLLVVPGSPAFFLTFAGAPWMGPGLPASVPLAVLDDPALSGVVVYAQGMLVDPTFKEGIGIALTGALMLTFGP